jgi:Tfp pilus assembly protein PilO
MKSSLREAILGALLTTLPVGAWWFVYRPANICNAKIMTQIEAKQQKLRALNRITATIGDLQKEIASRKEAIEYFQKKLPNEKEMDRVLQEIWRLAETSKLKTKSIRTLTKLGTASLGTPSGPQEQPIAVQLEGPFTGFYTFLQSLENQPRIMRINKLSLITNEKDNNGQVEAAFEMSVFFEQEGKAEKCLSTR